MTGGYDIWVKTAKDLDAPESVRKLLRSWCDHRDPQLRPEFFGQGEPVRRSFEKEGVEAAIRLWLEARLPLMLRRRGKPRFLVDFTRRPLKGKVPLLLPWSCLVTLDSSAGDDLAISLFRFLIEHLEGAFGWITTGEDLRAKHWITYQDRLGRVERYMGLDVIDQLPGIYWITYFGPVAMRLLRRNSLNDLTAYRVEALGPGYLVWTYPVSSSIGTSDGRQAESQIRHQLGTDRTFDKAQVDINKLQVDEATAARVERKIEDIRKSRKRP